MYEAFRRVRGLQRCLPMPSCRPVTHQEFSQDFSSHHPVRVSGSIQHSSCQGTLQRQSMTCQKVGLLAWGLSGSSSGAHSPLLDTRVMKTQKGVSPGFQADPVRGHEDQIEGLPPAKRGTQPWGSACASCQAELVRPHWGAEAVSFR